MEISKTPVINRNANAKKKFYGFTTYDVDNIPRTELWMIYRIVMCTIWSNNKEAFSIYKKYTCFVFVTILELVSKELNHLAAILNFMK